jgi:ornithine cyclodeaminase/alanine dehydrogenase-like protein (mu-crystallin family)
MIDADTLRAAVGFDDLVEPTAQAFVESSAGLADNGLLTMFPAERPELGDVYVKTGSVRGHAVYIVKVAPWFQANAETGSPQGGFVAVFDSATGHTLALVHDEHYLSDIRTAAAGAVAARALARATVDTVAVLGAGVQAYWQPLALFRERPFTRLSVWARRRDKAEALMRRLGDDLPGVEIGFVGDVETAVRGADVLITATQAREPVVDGRWLRPGAHVTAVGADDATKCELDVEALRRAKVFVDARATAEANGDVHRAIQAGGYTIDDLSGELGEVLAGRVAGRTADDDITIATLTGIGAQDLVAAEVALAALGAR